MKRIATISSILLLGTIGLLVTNFLQHETDLHLTFSEEDIYSDL